MDIGMIHKPGDLELHIKGRSENGTLGVPLGMVSTLLAAIGSVYPGTMMATTSDRGSSLSLVIKAEDYLAPISGAESVVAIRDDPDMVAFLSGLTNGTVGTVPPPWLNNMIAGLSESIVAGSAAINYVELSFKQPGGEWFYWTVTRPGRPSPHKLRQEAEAAVERVGRLARMNDGSEYEHIEGCQHVAGCDACWADRIRLALGAPSLDLTQRSE